MLRSLLRIATAQREAFTSALVNEADVLGPKLVETVKICVRFNKQEEGRRERIVAAYTSYLKQIDEVLEEDDG